MLLWLEAMAIMVGLEAIARRLEAIEVSKNPSIYKDWGLILWIKQNHLKILHEIGILAP